MGESVGATSGASQPGRIFHCNNTGLWYQIGDDGHTTKALGKDKPEAGDIVDFLTDWNDKRFDFHSADDIRDGGGGGRPTTKASVKNDTGRSGSVPAEAGPLNGLSTQAPTSAYTEDQKKKLGIDLVHILMTQEGLTQEQAIGVVASLRGESGLDPTCVQGGGFLKAFTPTGHDGYNKAEGFAQWDDDQRITHLLNYAEELGIDPTSPAAQVGFMLKEAKEMKDENGMIVLDKIRNGPDNAVAACYTWTHDYEQAAVPNDDGRNEHIDIIRGWL